MRAVIFLLLFFLSGQSGVMAQGQDDDNNWRWLSELDAETGGKILPGWRWVSRDHTAVRSDCVGSMESVDCMIDTMFVCSKWSGFIWSGFSIPEAVPKERYWDNFPNYYWHPICDTLPRYEDMKFKPESKGFMPLSMGMTYGRDNILTLYASSSFILQPEDDIGEWVDCDRELGSYKSCIGNTIHAIHYIDCYSKIHNLDQAFRADIDVDFIKGLATTPTTEIPALFCDKRWEAALIVAPYEEGQGWKILTLFHERDAGPRYEGWPRLGKEVEWLRSKIIRP